MPEGGRWRAAGGHAACRVILALVLMCGTIRAHADDLSNLITNLWPGGILLEPAAGPFSHQPHFRVASLEVLDSLNSGIASSITTFAPSAGVGSFLFDPELGVPVLSSEPLGPLLVERALTIGRRKLNLAVSYTSVNYKRFEGEPLDNLHLQFQHEDTNEDGKLGDGPNNIFEFERETIEATLDAKIKQDIVALFATYGVTDRWDVGVVVPLVRVSMDVTGHAEVHHVQGVNPNTHRFGPNSSPQDVHSQDEESGIGDILLRTKYTFLRDQAKLPDMAIVGRVRLPTGDEDNLLGTGDTRIAAIFVASKTIGRIAPHLNLGYEASTEDSDENIVSYVVGLEASLTPRVTGSVDVVGAWRPHGTEIGENIVDIALGLKWNPTRTFVIGGVVSLPLNKDEGLRADAIWSVAAEYTF